MFSALIAIAWLYQPWSGYQPAAQFDEAVEDGRTVLRLRSIKVRKNTGLMVIVK